MSILLKEILNLEEANSLNQSKSLNGQDKVHAIAEKVLKSILIDIKERSPYFKDSESGICSLIVRLSPLDFLKEQFGLIDAHKIVNCTVSIFNEITTKWPKFSGDKGYPVPGTHGDSAEYAYYNCYIWKGEYGDLRKELLDFAIEYLGE
ncbi:hypothetical protein KNT64_gp199 [Pseudomonas phage PspYZU05]|uniref:Uncharacterized protein n=1 Tax=Pseudomonas phage PspYZU05 TaxID=1983556 RepID=A0A2U7NF81_9CAUD|nr:hypothetical protein KNT64_gp199 [Pseudomonas phage PspYZU05]ASD52151.1 hypothetical protein PspYZU05_199 [Pseudomonas phage PspYZU05]